MTVLTPSVHIPSLRRSRQKSVVRFCLPIVFVPAGIGGLTQDSVVLCEQIRVIDKRRIIKVPGHLDEPHVQQIAHALSVILGL
jgi:mRNA-degrading endonuclease toxin of MazEF toxin-antitoxin module